MFVRSTGRRGASRIVKLVVAAAALASAGLAPHAAADSDLTLQDPWTSSCYKDRIAIDKQQMTREDGHNAGQVTAYYSPSCETNWIEVFTPFGVNNRNISVSLFIGLTEAPWTNDSPEIRYENHGQLTNEFRTMMVHAPGATCIHYWAAVSDIGGPDYELLGTTSDKTICG